MAKSMRQIDPETLIPRFIKPEFLTSEDARRPPDEVRVALPQADTGLESFVIPLLRKVRAQASHIETA
jgi:hypothetical protein